MNFNADDDGYVGLIFRMKNKQNFYIIEVHGEVKLQSKLKKVVDGKYRQIALDDKTGYTKGKWYQLQVLMSGSTFRVYLQQINGTTLQLFGEDVLDEQPHNEGTIAISSFMTRAAYDNIQMFPQNDIPKPQESAMEELPLIEPLKGGADTKVIKDPAPDKA